MRKVGYHLKDILPVVILIGPYLKSFRVTKVRCGVETVLQVYLLLELSRNAYST